MKDICCHNNFDSSALNQKQRLVLIVVLIINACTFLMMVIAAKISGSASLLSGALDNLGDALTYVISLMVIGAAPYVKARVAMFKGLLILGSALVVAYVIILRLLHPETPIFETMGLAALVNLVANLSCLLLLTPYRHKDVNMASAWECSRNDVAEGFAVILAALAVWIFNSGWPDLIIAFGLLIMFSRSAARVFQIAWQDLRLTSDKT